MYITRSMYAAHLLFIILPMIFCIYLLQQKTERLQAMMDAAIQGAIIHESTAFMDHD